VRAPEFWSRSETPPFWAWPLAPAAWAYSAAGAIKQRFARPKAVSVPVFCIGNLTAGGVGKTPVALTFARQLCNRGLPPFFLSRGYGGRLKGPVRVDPDIHSAREVGDEPLLLSSTAPVIVSADRAAGAAMAVSLGARAIVMDDGFQNFGLAKDLAVVVADGQQGFGNRQVLPLGPLREPVARGLARADAVVQVGGGAPLPVADTPVLQARLRSLAMAPKGPLVAFAGIGRPDKFFDSLRDAGGQLADAVPFPDHHHFSDGDLSGLAARARAFGATLITTEKDAVRLPPAIRADVVTFPVEAVFADPLALDRLIAAGLERFAARAAA